MDNEQMIYTRKSSMELNKIYYWTATIHNWIKLLEPNVFKQIILDSFIYLTNNNFLKIYAFVIMPNHIHLFIENIKMNKKEMPYVSFLKYTAHQFKNRINEFKEFDLNLFYVNEINKKYNFWQRDSLAIELYSTKFVNQKLEYIHNNPCQERWQLSNNPINYVYSSAYFYDTNIKNYNFLNNIYEEL